MNATLGSALLLIALFVVAYTTKRRFGALGLALCAGLVLSNSWSSSLTPFLQQQGFILVSPPLASVVAGGLLLLPAVLLLFSGPTYNKPLGRIGGAIAFAVFAFVLLLGQLGTAFTTDAFSVQVYQQLSALSSLITVAAIGLAVADTLLIRTPKRHAAKDGH